MKATRHIIAIMILVILSWDHAISGNSAGNESNPNETGFALVKDASGVSIYTRWIPVTETRSARQIKAVIVMDGTVASVLSVLRDDRSFTKWMNGTKDYYRIKTLDSASWYSYVQFQIPWPLNNQDCIIKYNVTEDPSAGKTILSLKATPSFLKSFDGVKRIPHMEGSWVITNLGNNKVMVEYTMFSNQKPSFPRWITDPIIQNNLLKTMEAFRNSVKSYTR